MTFTEIQEANKQINTMPITRKNKDTGEIITRQYAEVNERIKAFRFLYPNGSIETDLLSNADGVCIFRAIIKDDAGKVLGTGTAYEKESNGYINKTSYIENCETSAVGRALGMCGLGIDTSIASYEEVSNAIAQQEEPKTKPKNKDDKQAQALEEAKIKTTVIKYLNNNVSKDNIPKILAYYKVNSASELTLDNCNHYLDSLRKRGIKINE